MQQSLALGQLQGEKIGHLGRVSSLHLPPSDPSHRWTMLSAKTRDCHLSNGGRNRPDRAATARSYTRAGSQDSHQAVRRYKWTGCSCHRRVAGHAGAALRSWETARTTMEEARQRVAAALGRMLGASDGLRVGCKRCSGWTDQVAVGKIVDFAAVAKTGTRTPSLLMLSSACGRTADTRSEVPGRCSPRRYRRHWSIRNRLPATRTLC